MTTNNLHVLARKICHAVEQRSDDCDMEMHGRILTVLETDDSKNVICGLNDLFARWRFADWYALHGIPLGIGRDNAHALYVSAIQVGLNNAVVAGRILAEKLLRSHLTLNSDEESAVDFFLCDRLPPDTEVFKG